MRALRGEDREGNRSAFFATTSYFRASCASPFAARRPASTPPPRIPDWTCTGECPLSGNWDRCEFRRHFDCFWSKNRKYPIEESFADFADLKPEDQEKLREHFSEGTQGFTA